MDEVIAAMVEQARAAGHTRAHAAFESFRWAFGVKWSETKPVIRPPDQPTETTEEE